MDKLVEGVKLQQVYDSEAVTSAGTLYNATAGGVTGQAIDTQDYEEIMIMVNAGLVAGDGTLDVTLVNYATDDSSSAVAVTDAAMDQLKSTRKSDVYVAQILADRCLRYVWVKTVKGGTGSTPFGIVVALKPKRKPVTQPNTPDFDLDV